MKTGYILLNQKSTRKELKITFVCIDNESPVIGVCSYTHKPAVYLRLHQGLIGPLFVNPSESRCALEKNCLNSSCPINKTAQAKINKWMTLKLEKWFNEDWPAISNQYRIALEIDPSTNFVPIDLKFAKGGCT
jgi:hypothetical protein